MPVTKKPPIYADKIEILFKKNGEIKESKKQQKEMPQIEVDGEMMEQCANCGNIWDGYAQCNCWQMDYYESDESGYDSE